MAMQQAVEETGSKSAHGKEQKSACATESSRTEGKTEDQWVEYYSEEHKCRYFVNASLGQSRWTRPSPVGSWKNFCEKWADWFDKWQMDICFAVSALLILFLLKRTVDSASRWEIKDPYEFIDS
jgi:hypothetical protein